MPPKRITYDWDDCIVVYTASKGPKRLWRICAYVGKEYLDWEESPRNTPSAKDAERIRKYALQNVPSAT